MWAKYTGAWHPRRPADRNSALYTAVSNESTSLFPVGEDSRCVFSNVKGNYSISVSNAVRDTEDGPYLDAV
jgi:hypothetical protein